MDILNLILLRLMLLVIRILINYLTSYPLFTSKYLNYMDWVYSSNLFYKKEHKNPIVYEEIRTLKFNMNNGRKVFTWDHLKNFY